MGEGELLEAQGQKEFAARIMRDFATRHPETAAVATEAHQNCAAVPAHP